MSDKQRHCVAATYAVIHKDFRMSRTIHSNHSNGSQLEVCFKPRWRQRGFSLMWYKLSWLVRAQYLSCIYYLLASNACLLADSPYGGKRRGFMLEDLRKL